MFLNWQSIYLKSTLKEWRLRLRESSVKLVLSFFFFLILVTQPRYEVLDQITSLSVSVMRSDPVSLSAGHLCPGSCTWSCFPGVCRLWTLQLGERPDQTVTAANGKAVRFSMNVYKIYSHGLNSEVSFVFFLQEVDIFLRWKLDPSIREPGWMAGPEETCMVTSLFAADTKVMDDV